MTIHLQKDLELLKKELLGLGALVERALREAVLSLVDRRSELAATVVAEAHAVDDKEVWIEDLCLKILALHQPVAVDLRFIVGILKVNNDLERLGDLAVNIARRSAQVIDLDPLSQPLQFSRMADVARDMVKKSLDALVTMDSALAFEVLRTDDKGDEIMEKMFALLQGVMREDSSTVEVSVHLLSICRHLERVADLATNIAEDVIFMVDGRTVRHMGGAIKTGK
jgi:phosphate transport system protein